ncbi:hypothetical protein [Nocardia coubleae]|uniref:Uncharacterized protein n=1 Tax=Nocardia coubleae TaxID=356147 RepID=A0A846W8D6_9NOCA|nr:hypothetical protein [Nocardia coubleae]NKX89642.1 hypothetical protein [Nocardia coubleae]
MSARPYAARRLRSTLTSPAERPTLILDPDLGPVELHAGEATTVTAVFRADESSPWRAVEHHLD